MELFPTPHRCIFHVNGDIKASGTITPNVALNGGAGDYVPKVETTSVPDAVLPTESRREITHTSTGYNQSYYTDVTTTVNPGTVDEVTTTTTTLLSSFQHTTSAVIASAPYFGLIFDDKLKTYFEGHVNNSAPGKSSITYNYGFPGQSPLELYRIQLIPGAAEPYVANKCEFKVNGAIEDENSNTIIHRTVVENGTVGRFCECSTHMYAYPKGATATNCIPYVRAATSLTERLLGIIVSSEKFASHGDVLVRVDATDSEGTTITYAVGDLLVPTPTGSRPATTNDKNTIMSLGLPRVRVMSTEEYETYPSCLACFIS
jgi:hypothetical protein